MPVCKYGTLMMTYQESLFPGLTASFPSTRYQGSKSKLAEWIWEQVAPYDFSTCLDAFGGTGAVAYRLKKAGKQVIYNDVLRFNYQIGKALIENSHTKLTTQEIDDLLQPRSDVSYPSLIRDTFDDIYFTRTENEWLDQTITNFDLLTDPYKYALAFFAVCQACIIKRPYNLFHRKNLYVRFADVDRTFGNKASWDKPFEQWFRYFVQEANAAIFNNGHFNVATNYDAIEVPGEFDLVYVDPPYISNKGTAVDYLEFYHFLEGLSDYDQWKNRIDYRSKHRRWKRAKNRWADRRQIYNAFYELFERYRESQIVVSYRSDGIPSVHELTTMLRKFKTRVTIHSYGSYKYALSKNMNSSEVLLIGQ
jgi:adenine-specific DNA methylase